MNNIKSYKSENIIYPHGFFTRLGGFSIGELEGLNFGGKFGETADAKIKNNKLLADAFNIAPENIVLTNQKHTADILILGQNSPEQADAIVTNKPGKLIGVITADCCPILMIDKTHNVISAIHAGWRGAFKDIIKNAVNAMCNLGANKAHIKAAIGPTISQESYEVDETFYNEFINKDIQYKKFFDSSKKENHFQFNLPSFIENEIANQGVSNINNIGIDTYSNANEFYSCRRSHHNGTNIFGNQFSGIMIPEF